MQFIIIAVFFVGSIFIAFEFTNEFEGLIMVVISTILGFVLAKVFSLQKDLNDLKATLASEWEERNSTQNQSKKVPIASAEDSNTSHSDTATSVVAAKTTGIWQEATIKDDFSLASSTHKMKASHGKITKSDVDEVAQVLKAHKARVKGNSKPTGTASSFDSAFDNAGEVIKGYFTGGNLFVRVGIIILFFGVSFLLKYVSDRGMFPIEYRLTGVVVFAIALLGLGWRLRLKNETYALLLQGAGIGILYLDIYAAFSMYQLLPPLAAFALLFVVSMFSAALAVLQDSKSLAVLGFSGGFVAPILASSGSNNHVGLFSYYAVLNLAIVVVAWFKAWRPLNILGFAFTFIISTAWGVSSYNSDKFATTEPFLILFFLFYVLIAVLFALRQPPKLRGYVDGTLLFGVPLAASGLQYSLLKDTEFGVSISAFTMGLFYLSLSWFVLKRKGDSLKLLSEAFLAVGVIFASMAIPFALAPTQTAAAWAMEGAGLLWLGSRQNRLSVRAFGLLLQFGAAISFLYSNNPFVNMTAESRAFINGDFMSTIMLAIAGIVSSRLLMKAFEGRKTWEQGFSSATLLWGLAWLFGGFIYQLVTYYPVLDIPAYLVIFTSLVSLLFIFLAVKLKPVWNHAWLVSSLLFGLILISALLQFAFNNYESDYHPLQNNGWIAWPIAFAAYYFLLLKLERHSVLVRYQAIIHSLLLLLLVVLVTFEGLWQLKGPLSSGSDWVGIWLILPSIIALWLIIKAKIWPFSAHKNTYQQQTGMALAAVMLIWSFISLSSKGTADPLPWIPLINPLDIISIIVFITLFKWWQTISDNFVLLANQSEKSQQFNKRVFAIGIASLVFLWLNFTVFRIAYHWFDVAYDANQLYQSNLVQTAVSILWALSGVLLTVYASRKNIRFLWISGAVLLGLVVLKLFVIDLSTLGSLARIISFLVVGVLLTSIGYFAPLPENDDALLVEESSDEITKKNKQ